MQGTEEAPTIISDQIFTLVVLYTLRRVGALLRAGGLSSSAGDSCIVTDGNAEQEQQETRIIQQDRTGLVFVGVLG